MSRSGPPAANHGREARLASYVPRLALEWLATAPAERHRRLEGTLVFVDVSGFTALTERLSVRGRAGAEEITDIVGSTFSELAAIAGRYGADLLKWGGDAALLLFRGPGSAARGARTGWLMAQAMRRLGRVRTSAGRVELRVSVGVHSGTFDAFLVGLSHRELIIAGAGATLTAQMEAAASAGEVVVSPATSARLEPGRRGQPAGPGFLLGAEPEADEHPLPPRAEPPDDHVAPLLSAPVRRYLLAGAEQAEHRPVAIGFVQVSGLDAVIEEGGGTAAVRLLDPLVSAAQEAASRHEVSFHATDLSADGVKILLLGGVPVMGTDFADRLLRSALEITRGNPALTVRAGVNVGRTFVFAGLGLAERRIYSLSGDAVNLAARVTGAAAGGQVLCTESTLAALRSPFVVRPLPPFAAKGKAEPVVAYAVGEEGGARDGGEPLAPLVGRRQELDLLLGAAAIVREGGQGQVVEIVGPAGIGKSRLVAEAAQEWQLATWNVAGDAFTGGRPYRPVRAMARRLLGLEDSTPGPRVAAVLTSVLEQKAPALAPWAPLLADVFDVALPPSAEVNELEPRFRRPRLEAAFVELAAALAPGPTAFVFEDSHALDQASAGLVLRMAEQCEGRPWLVVTTRLPDAPDVLQGGSTAPTLIELGALDREMAEHLVAALGDDALSPRQRRLLVERGAGNPLFLLELARTARAGDAPEALPDALEPLLASRVDRLAPLDRRALRTAAVLGMRFSDALLSAVIEEPGSVDAGLWARLSEFVQEEAGERIFTHALLRDAAYEGLPFRRRRELHARAAAAIEERAAAAEDAIELLSLHWSAAERWDRAWVSARRAGERAAGLYANADAAAHFRRALGAARHLKQLSAQDVARVGERLGDAYELAGTYPEARAAYGHARRKATTAPDRARLLRKLGVLHERQGQYAQALRCYTVGEAHLDRPADQPASGLGAGAGRDTERCELGLATAGVLHRQGRLRQSIAAAAAAGEEAARAGYRRGLAHSLYLRHINSVYLNEPDDALAADALAIFVELKDLVGQGNVLNNLGISAYYRGAWNEALGHYGASRDARERTGDLVGTATEENNIGEILSDQGYYDQARTCFEAAQSSWRAARYRIGEALAASNLGRLAARAGRGTEGMELLGQARAAFEAIHAGPYVDETDLRLLECTLLAGQARRAAVDGDKLAGRFCGRPGYERLYAAARRLEGVALAELGAYAAARRSLDQSVVGLRTISEAFELAQSLMARSWSATKAQAAPGPEDGPTGGGRGGPDGGADEAEARDLLAHLGVVSTPAPPGAAGLLSSR